jgi:WD40 repeat protein
MAFPRQTAFTLLLPVLALVTATWWQYRERVSWQPRLMAQTKGAATLTLSHDGRWLAVGNDAKNQLVDTATGISRALPASSLWIFSPNDRWLLGRSATEARDEANSDELIVLDTQDWTTVRTLSVPVPNGSHPGYKSDCGAAAILNDGTLRVLAKDKIQDWPPTSTSPIRQVTLHSTISEYFAGACAFSPDGSKLLIGFNIWNRDVAKYLPAIFDAETGRILRVLPAAPDWILKVGWSPDERVISVTDAQGAGTSLRDAATGQQLWAFEDRDLAYSRDCRQVVARDAQDSQYRLALRETEDGRIIGHLDFMPPEPSGRFVINPNDDNLLISGHEGGVYSVRIN